MKKFKKTEWLHFLPFVIYEIFQIPKFFQSSESISKSYTTYRMEGLPLEFILYNWAVIVQGFTYIILTLLILRQYASHIKDLFSSIEKIRLNWLRNITYLLIVFLGTFLIENLLLLIGINLSDFFNLSSG